MANQLTAGQSANSQEESSKSEEDGEEVEQSCETKDVCVARLIKSPSDPTSRQSHKLVSS